MLSVTDRCLRSVRSLARCVPQPSPVVLLNELLDSQCQSTITICIFQWFGPLKKQIRHTCNHSPHQPQYSSVNFTAIFSQIVLCHCTSKTSGFMPDQPTSKTNGFMPDQPTATLSALTAHELWYSCFCLWADTRLGGLPVCLWPLFGLYFLDNWPATFPWPLSLAREKNDQQK